MNFKDTIPCNGGVVTEAADAAVEYVRVLHAHGVGSAEAEAFKEEHKGEPGFLRRATGAERLVQYRDEILREIGDD
jgi:hypothetical protein